LARELTEHGFDATAWTTEWAFLVGRGIG